MTISRHHRTATPLTVLLLTSAATLAACKAPDISPPAGHGDPVPAPYNDPQISVLSPDLRGWLAFQPAIIEDDGTRPLTVQVPVRNLAERQYLIDYRFLFYSENGMELEPVMGWRMASLQPKEIVRLKANAMGRDARDYRLEIKWAR